MEEGKIYEHLSADLPVEAIQESKKEQTKKGYDTTGYSYMYCVNRFNEVLGLEKWGYDYKILKETPGQFRSSGTPNFEITVDVSIWLFTKENVRSAVGSHLSISHGDALKGAITNAFKKTAAFWGVGKKAYEGMLDDDLQHRQEGENDRLIPPEPQTNKEFAEELSRGDNPDHEIRAKMGALIFEMAVKGDKLAHNLTRLYSTFEKDGEIVVGKTNLEDLKGKWLASTYGKVKKAYEVWQTNKEAFWFETTPALKKIEELVK